MRQFLGLLMVSVLLAGPAHAITIDLPDDILTALKQALGTAEAPAPDTDVAAFLLQHALIVSRARIDQRQRAQAQEIGAAFVSGDAVRQRAILEATKQGARR